jgi:hypothetical protein
MSSYVERDKNPTQPVKPICIACFIFGLKRTRNNDGFVCKATNQSRESFVACLREFLNAESHCRSKVGKLNPERAAFCIASW